MTQHFETTPNIEYDVNLRPFNTLGVASLASRFCRINSEKDLNLLWQKGALKEDGVRVIGSGSNILFREKVPGLLLKMDIGGITFEELGRGRVRVEAGGGINWHHLVETCVGKDLGGLENLALIPGTVGAAPVQNIGAYGVELESVFDSLSAFDLKTGATRTFDRTSSHFSYRDSLFKSEEPGRFIITKVRLLLNHPPHSVQADYRSLAEWLEKKGVTNPTIQDIFRAVIEIRQSKLPDPEKIGNAGSFFKNPVISASEFETLKRTYSNIPGFIINSGEVKIPAAWLIEKAGWKGRRKGAVGVYENQALVIVNHGGASGGEIWSLAREIAESVNQMFSIELTPEVNVIGTG